MKIKLFNIQVNISFLFLSVITLMIFIDKSGLVLPMLLSVLLHEAAHIFAMIFVGSKIKTINLIPCSVEITRDFCENSYKEIIISLAGPLLNFILFIIFFKSKFVFSIINLCFCVFNILPLSTLDGGEILKIILSKNFSAPKVNLILKAFNLTFGIFGLIAGIVLFAENKLNLTLILFSLYIIILNIIKI